MIQAEFEDLVRTTLPLPPGINASYKTVNFKTKEGYIVRRPGATPELEAFKQEAHLAMYMDKHLWDWDALAQIKASKCKIPLAVTIDLYFRTRWKRDIDGPEKAAIDAVFSYVRLNDNLIVEKHTRKLVDRDNPRCEISICKFQETKQGVLR
jgi:Holliday junction resolvase RusA-like endonuclease